jgi:hypothetical protein
MIALEVPIVFHPEVHWTTTVQQSARSRRSSKACLLPWICLALLDTRSRRRARKRRF